MKPEKAIWHYMALKEDYLSRKSFISREKIDEISKEVIAMLEKQVPKKPRYYIDNWGHNRPGCPGCPRNEILYAGQKYCSVCGTKIDWGKENEGTY